MRKLFLQILNTTLAYEPHYTTQIVWRSVDLEIILILQKKITLISIISIYFIEDVNKTTHVNRLSFLYSHLPLSATEEEAAEAYDIAAIKFRGLNAVTNFEINRYDVKAILESNTLPIGGGAAKRLKEAQALESSRKREEMRALSSNFHQYGAASGSSSGLQLQSYPLSIQQPFEHLHHQPLLTLQNNDVSQYNTNVHDSYSYIQTQLHLHQQQTNNCLQSSSHSSQLYNAYLQRNPGLLHGFVSDNNNASAVYGNNGIGIGSTSTVGTSAEEEFPTVKVDYDMPPSGGATGYEGWTNAEHGQGSNPGGVFTMWNE